MISEIRRRALPGNILIESQWNLNIKILNFKKNIASILIESQWNLNTQEKTVNYTNQSNINRITVECKFVLFYIVQELSILIET